MRVLMITTDWPSSFMELQVACLQKIGVSVQVFYFHGAKNPINYLRAWRQVRLITSQTKFDLLHAQFGQSTFAALMNPLPLVVTFRGSDVHGIVGSDGKYLLVGNILRTFSYLAALIANEAVVVSEPLIDKLPKRKYHVIPSGVNLELFHPIERQQARHVLGWESEDIVIFFGGNPEIPEKRYDLACASVNILKEKLPNLKMVVAKNINYSQMPLYINSSNLLLLTSAHEGSPNVVKEAIACNIPVVATNVGDVQLRIGKIEGCIVCTDDNPQTIANAIWEVLEKKIHIAGRETILDLDENLLAKKMVDVYRQAINKKRKNPNIDHNY